MALWDTHITVLTCALRANLDDCFNGSVEGTCFTGQLGRFDGQNHWLSA